jgi:hypothetical protein
MLSSHVAEMHHLYAAPASTPDKILMRLRLLPYYTVGAVGQLLENERQLILGLGLLCPLNFV